MAITNSVADVTAIIRGLIKDKSRTDGRDSFVYESDNIFTLTEDYLSSSTITVFKNGTELTGLDFSYDADNNQVTINVSLSADDTIIIKYHYYQKYSDVEIQGFLESSLSYFPQYQYKKTFIINSSDELVAENDSNPTTEELYFIANIASILIDPQNFRISIPDLSIDAIRNESDQEQIRKAFRHFQNFVGVIDYEIIQNLIN